MAERTGGYDPKKDRAPLRFIITSDSDDVVELGADGQPKGRVNLGRESAPDTAPSAAGGRGSFTNDQTRDMVGYGGAMTVDRNGGNNESRDTENAALRGLDNWSPRKKGKRRGQG
jgi:hypothetical protein